MERMVRRTIKQSALIVLPLAIASLFLKSGDWRIAFSVLVGGALSLGSFGVIVWAVRKFLGQEMGSQIIAGLSFFKIFLMFGVLVVLALLRLIHPVGVVVGFTAVLVIIVKEGLIFAQREA